VASPRFFKREQKSMVGFKFRTQDTLFNYGQLPDIDITRVIATYLRQSRKDADDKNGESRKTQLELKNYALKLSGEKGAGVRQYDEGAGTSGQKRIDERPELNRLYKDIEANLISIVIVSREDRLFRDKWGIQSETFMELAARKRVVVIVPPLSINGRPRFYDFSNDEHVKAFKHKMEIAYDYVATHIKYMNANKRNKTARGNYDGRSLIPGLVVPKGQDKMEQKIDIYPAWAEIMEKLYSTWEAYDYSIPMLVRYVESLPYLFPDIPEEDAAKYCFRAVVRKVPGGFKPENPETIKNWFRNVACIGWWLVSIGSGEVIPDNHPAIFERERFEKGYIQLTGHTLEGVPVQLAHAPKRHQARREAEVAPQAVLRFVLTCPMAPWVGVSVDTSVCKYEVKKKLYYKGDIKADGDIYSNRVFCINCEDLDEIVVKRLEHLSEVDKQLASRIEQSLEEVRLQQIQECVPLEDQIRQIDTKLKKLMARLAEVSDMAEDDEDEAVVTIMTKIQGLRGQKRELEEKKKMLNTLGDKEEVRKFYTVLGNFKEQWPKLTIEQKQRLIKLLTTKVEITPCSMHWYKLTIHWIGPVCNRPDVALIWRMRPEVQPALEKWELDLIREHYSSCSMEYLLERMPSRTWQTIQKNACILGAQRDRGITKTIPANVAWGDISFFPEKDKAIEMAVEAAKECMKQRKLHCAKWFITLPITKEHTEEDTITNDINEGWLSSRDRRSSS